MNVWKLSLFRIGKQIVSDKCLKMHKCNAWCLQRFLFWRKCYWKMITAFGMQTFRIFFSEISSRIRNYHFTYDRNELFVWCNLIFHQLHFLLRIQFMRIIFVNKINIGYHSIYEPLIYMKRKTFFCKENPP